MTEPPFDCDGMGASHGEHFIRVSRFGNQEIGPPFISPWINWTTDTPTDRIIGEAVGAASLCWNPPPEGVFDPARANDIVEAVMDVLRRKLWTDA